MSNLLAGMLGRTRTLVMLLVLLLVAGFGAYQSIPKESNPDVEIAHIWVSLTHHGISPEDAERLLIRPIENELKAIAGVKEMSSTSREGGGSVSLEFNAGFDSDKALADVRDKVSIAKARLPSEAEEPVVNEVTMADEQSVLNVTLSGNVSPRGLIMLARELRDRLEGLPEVLEVDIAGDREEMVEIIVDPLLMESYSLNQNEIYNLVSNNNRLVAAGTLDNGNGRFAIKVPSVFETVNDLLTLPIKVVDGKTISFGDVSEIRRSFKDPNSFARLNAESAVVLEIKKRAGENIISTVEKSKALIEAAKTKFPESVSVTYTGDQSEEVNDMLSDLQNNVISAVILVFVVVIAALGIRSALLVGIAIPGAFLMGILSLSMADFTVNVVVLFGLIMAVGMLVDGAIVVVEYADRKMNEGVSKLEAYTQASQKMSWPIIASTATTLAAFAPLMFWPGMMGQFMRYLPITLIFVLTGSLLMALVFVPALGKIFGKPRKLSDSEKHQVEVSEAGNLEEMKGFTGKYIKVLSKAIESPIKVLVLMAAISATVFIGYGKSGLGVEFFPNIEPDSARLIVRSHGDLSIWEKDAVMKKVEDKILFTEGVETIYTRTGGSDRVGIIRLNFLDWDERDKASEILKRIEAETSTLAGVEVEARQNRNGPNSGKDIRLEISSKLPELLNETVLKIRQAMDNDDRLTAIEDNATRDGIEWQLKIDRGEASKYGANATLVGSTVSMVTNGIKIGEYRPDDVDDELDIRVRYPDEYRNLNQLDQLRVNTQNGLVPVGQFIERTASKKVDSIKRIDGKRVVRIQADLVEGQQLVAVLPDLKQKLVELDVDPRVEISFKGQNQDQQESGEFLKNAFMVALFVMAIILVTQFNSFYQAGLILSAVVFSTVGVFLAMMITGRPFGIVMGGIGVISLAGIVVNNNIVLIDTFNTLKARGLSAKEAILRTGAQRLRPVTLTTATTMLGLLPMVLEMNIDFFGRTVSFGAPSTQWWSGLATAVAGGLLFATLLTLILTPCLLMWRERRQK